MNAPKDPLHDTEPQQPTTDNNTSSPKWVQWVERQMRPRAPWRSKKPAGAIIYPRHGDRMFALAIDVALPIMLSQGLVLGIGPYARSLAEGSLAIGVLADVLSTALFFALYLLPLWIYGGLTPGKWLLQQRIVDFTTLQPATMRQCIMRYVFMVLTNIIGSLYIFVDTHNRALYDCWSGTCVVGVRSWHFGSVPPEKIKRS